MVSHRRGRGDCRRALTAVLVSIGARDFVQVAKWYKEQGMPKGELDVKGLIDKRYAIAVVLK